MLILSQLDKRWASTKLGASTSTVGRYGCVVTSISMALSWANAWFSPDWLARHLTFTNGGLVIWSSIGQKTALEFVWRAYPANFKQAQVDEALKSKEKVCLLNVDRGSHWVLGIYRVPFTTKYWVADPLTGSRKFYSGVIGYAILQKK